MILRRMLRARSAISADESGARSMPSIQAQLSVLIKKNP
jgi:hypothetical protein